MAMRAVVMSFVDARPNATDQVSLTMNTVYLDQGYVQASQVTASFDMAATLTQIAQAQTAAIIAARPPGTTLLAANVLIPTYGKGQ